MDLRNDIVKAEEEYREEFDILNNTKDKADMDYIQNKKCMASKDNIQEMSKRLEALYGLVTTVCLGLQAECVEKQAIECLECIAQCVWDIKIMADNIYSSDA